MIEGIKLTKTKDGKITTLVEKNFNEGLCVIENDGKIYNDKILDYLWWDETEYTPLELNKSFIFNDIFIFRSDNGVFEMSCKHFGENTERKSKFFDILRRWEHDKNFVCQTNPKRSLIYFMDNGGVAIFDGIRHKMKSETADVYYEYDTKPLVMTQQEIFDGYFRKDVCVCNGLTYDVVEWFKENGEAITFFKDFVSSVCGDVTLTKDGYTRKSPYSIRDVPIIKLSGIEMPITNVPRNTRNIISMIYVISWLFRERKYGKELTNYNSNELDDYVIMIGENIIDNRNTLTKLIKFLNTKVNIQILALRGHNE